VSKLGPESNRPLERTRCARRSAPGRSAEDHSWGTERESLEFTPIAAEEPVHLVEVEIDSNADCFDFGAITQEMPSQPQSNWQVAYDEREVGQNRSAFFFHYLDIAKPLVTPAGPLALPPETPVPEHLRSIEYEPP
jgi:hypothetical protein